MTTGPWVTFLLPTISSNARIACIANCVLFVLTGIGYTPWLTQQSHQGAKGQLHLQQSTKFKFLPAAPGVPNWSPIQLPPRANDSNLCILHDTYYATRYFFLS